MMDDAFGEQQTENLADFNPGIVKKMNSLFVSWQKENEQWN